MIEMLMKGSWSGIKKSVSEFIEKSQEQQLEMEIRMLEEQLLDEWDCFIHRWKFGISLSREIWQWKWGSLFFFLDTAPVPQRSKRHDQDNDLSRPHVLNVVNLPKGNLNKTCGYLLFGQQPRIASINGVVLARSWWYIDRVTQLRLTQ